ncbi:hypothetical protein [Streptomyces sp. JNUCC 63]
MENGVGGQLRDDEFGTFREVLRNAPGAQPALGERLAACCELLPELGELLAFLHGLRSRKGFDEGSGPAEEIARLGPVLGVDGQPQDLDRALQSIDLPCLPLGQGEVTAT